jgi:hypothetical protein
VCCSPEATLAVRLNGLSAVRGFVGGISSFLRGTLQLLSHFAGKSP